MAGPVKTPRDYTFKYQGKNPLEKLRENEPYFFIRAQDKLSTAAVVFYADLLKKESERAYCAGDERLSNDLLKQALGVLKVVGVFASWQSDHPGFVKLPD
jgi:hypothetical protein